MQIDNNVRFVLTLYLLCTWILNAVMKGHYDLYQLKAMLLVLLF
jgi:hypothetical protein